MRFPALIAAIGGAALLAPMASAQQSITEEPSAGMKSCISANAANVERAVDDINEATTFLVKRICMSALTDQLIDMNKRQIAAQKEQSDAMCKEILAKPKPATKPANTFDQFAPYDDDAYLHEMCENPQPDYWAATSLNPQDTFFWDLKMTDFPRSEALAAQTLLKLRVERLNRKP